MYCFVPRCTQSLDKNLDRIVVVFPAVIYTGHEPEGGGRRGQRLCRHLEPRARPGRATCPRSTPTFLEVRNYGNTKR